METGMSIGLCFFLSIRHVFFQERWTTGPRKCFFFPPVTIYNWAVFSSCTSFVQLLVYIHLHSEPRVCFGVLNFIYHWALPYRLKGLQALLSGQTQMMEAVALRGGRLWVCRAVPWWVPLPDQLMIPVVPIRESLPLPVSLGAGFMK